MPLYPLVLEHDNLIQFMFHAKNKYHHGVMEAATYTLTIEL